MVDHVSELSNRSKERDNHPPFHELEESTDTLRDEPGGDVRLLKMDVCIVKYKRDTVCDRVLQVFLQNSECLLCYPGTCLSHGQHIGIEIDIEMFGLKNPPVEILIMHLVPPEIVVLGVQRSYRAEEYGHNCDQEQSLQIKSVRMLGLMF